MKVDESNIVERTDLLAFLEDPFLGCYVCIGSCWERHWRHCTSFFGLFYDSMMSFLTMSMTMAGYLRWMLLPGRRSMDDRWSWLFTFASRFRFHGIVT